MHAALYAWLHAFAVGGENQTRGSLVEAREAYVLSCPYVSSEQSVPSVAGLTPDPATDGMAGRELRYDVGSIDTLW